MPSGGDGYYYFSVFMRADGDETASFDVELNGEIICTVNSDLTESISTDSEMMSCSAVAYAVEGIRQTLDPPTRQCIS